MLRNDTYRPAQKDGTMHICVYADHQGHDWRAMLTAHGHRVTMRPVNMASDDMAFDAGIVVNVDPAQLLGMRFWLATLAAPLLLITPALIPAQALYRRVPSLRVICHPRRAAHSLAELLEMTCNVRAGTIVLGPCVETAPAEWDYGGQHVW